MRQHDRQSYEELKLKIDKMMSLFKGDVGVLLFGVVVLVFLIFMATFCGCSNRHLIDLNSCNYGELLDCVSSHRVETGREAINLVIACQRDVCMRSCLGCQKIHGTSFATTAGQ